MRSWVYIRIRRNPHGWPKTRRFFSVLVSIILILFLWHVLTGQVRPSALADTPPAGSPLYCTGSMGNDVGQGPIIDAKVDRDCPQFHAYRVALYQLQQDYLRYGEPVPAGLGLPWCPVLHESPCVPTPDMTSP